MSRWYTIGQAAGLVGLALLAFLPLLVQLPKLDALTIDHATFALDGAEPAEVSLPHSWPVDISPGRHVGEYRLVFTINNEEEGDREHFLLIPLTRFTPQIRLNGQNLFVVRADPWAAPLFEMPHLARLPEAAIRLGENILTVRMTREGGFRTGYLAQALIGSGAQILPHYQLLSLLTDLQRIAIPAWYTLLTIGVAGMWLARRHDAVYGWSCLMGVGFILANLAGFNPFNVLGDLSYTVMISGGSFCCMIIFGLACAMVGRERLRWLLPLAFLWSGTIIVTLTAYPDLRPLGVFFGLVAVFWLFAAVVVLGRAFWATRNTEYAMVMVGAIVFIGYACVDTDLISRVREPGVLLFLYPQIFLIAALALILFRRLKQSLDTLDTANETLRIRLNEQQDELARAHAHKTVLSSNLAREQERERLMRDLHDGLSGHIVSIIALAENAEEHDIETAAREALDDLRLVIQSLDIGDEDIPVILAYFRERTALQLRRLGIALEWSMDRLPAITGVTPGHALSLLRILQEAVTNAIKHGPARRITVAGEKTQGGSARITIENDGHNDLLTTGGCGLINMRERATSLGGTVMLEPIPTGMRLTLNLPVCFKARGAPTT